MAEWDVREILDFSRQKQREEESWLHEHKGALAASALGGCLRREKFRLMEAPDENPLTKGMIRRWRWGTLYENEVYEQLLAANRRPKRQVPVVVEIGGVTIMGHADFVMPEAVVEVKTTSAWEMAAEDLPFGHLIQIGTYQYALQKPGQLLYGSFHREWSFDLPAVPEIWEPYVQEVARQFAEHPEADPLPFLPQRQYCDSCAYLKVCPTDEGTQAAEPLSSLELYIVESYLDVRARSSAAEKEEKTWKAAVLGIREQRGSDEKGLTVLQLPRRRVVISQKQQHRKAYSVDERDIIITRISAGEEE